MITFSSNAHGIALDMIKSSKRVIPMISEVVKSNGDELLYLVKLGATGWRGGPEVRTGRYRNSIRQEFKQERGGARATVGTDEPYGLKLEQGGIVGAGAFGNVDDFHIIKPHPHFGMALDYLEEDFMKDINRAITNIPIGIKGVAG